MFLIIMGIIYSKNQIDFCKTTSRDCLDYSQFKTQTSISDFYCKGRNALLSRSFVTYGLTDLVPLDLLGLLDLNTETLPTYTCYMSITSQ